MGGRFSNVSQTLFLAKLTRERSRPFRLRQPRSSLQLGALQSEAFQPYSRSAAFNLLQPCGLATCSRQFCGLQLQPCSLPAFSFAAMQPCSFSGSAARAGGLDIKPQRCRGAIPREASLSIVFTSFVPHSTKLGFPLSEPHPHWQDLQELFQQPWIADSVDKARTF